MHRVSRRAVVLTPALFAFASLLRTHEAFGALARGLSLEELVGATTSGVVGTPLASECRWADFRGVRAIVTDTRVRVEELLVNADPGASEVIVRTLGGAIGDLGEHVDGQPRLVFGQPSVLFLKRSKLGIDVVVGMAQGHYPLKHQKDRSLRLTRSPALPQLVRSEGTAVARLGGLELTAARELCRLVAR